MADKNFKHFIDCWDFSTEELLDMANLIIELKKMTKAGKCPKLLEGASLAMIFNGNSTRTRVSFETAMTDLGGHGEFLTGGPSGELHLGKRETIGDSSRVISSMVNGVMMRWLNAKEMEEFAKHSSVPLLNGMCSRRHPTQTLCDLVTIIENMPEGKTLKDIVLCFFGLCVSTEVDCSDLAALLPRFGATVKLVGPKGFMLGEEMDDEGGNLVDEKGLIEWNRSRRERACKEGGGKIIESYDPLEAVKDVDFLYTGVVCYEGSESEEDMARYKRDFLDKGFQVNKELLSHNPNTMTMHYLPALRGKEMDDYAMDFEGSLLWKQAENRLHTQRGLLAYLMAPLHPGFENAGRTPEEEKIKSMIKAMRAKYGVGYTHE